MKSRRPLQFASLAALGINGVVGVGVFFAPQAVASKVPGWSGLWVYAAVAAMLVPVALVFAKLATVFDQDGGPYLYARAAFGETAAFCVGWLTYVSALFGTSTVVVGFVDALGIALDLSSRASHLTIALVTLCALSLLLAGGLRLSAWVWSTVTVAKILPMLALLVVALASGPTAGRPVLPGTPVGWRDVLAASLTVVFALQGFEVVPLPAAQVERATWAVPRATVVSLLVPALLYLGLHAACVRALPNLGGRGFPLADAALAYGGAPLQRAIMVSANLSALGIAVGMLAMTPRYLAVLGVHGALGRRLGEQNERSVPIYALAVTVAIVVIVVVSSILWGSMASLFAISSVSVIIQYGMTAAALFRLAVRKAKGLAFSDAWPAPLVVAACGLIALGASAAELAVVTALFAVGLVLWTLGKERKGRSACG